MNLLNEIKKLFTKQNGRCNNCKRAFKGEDLYILTYQDHRFLQGIKNPVFGIRTRLLCDDCYEKDSIVKEMKKLYELEN